MPHQDHERERVQAALRAQRIADGTEPPEQPPIISTPQSGNGKRWWWDAWGKAVGSILAAVILAAAGWLGLKALVIWGLPSRVDAVEADVRDLKARPQPMPPEVQADLSAFLKAWKEQQKGKP